MDVSLLEDAGLTAGEIKVYLALLELGTSTTGPVVQTSGIARSIVYQILDRLIEKGLASFIIREKTRYFQAAEPTKLLEYIDQRKDELEKNRAAVEKLLPELLAKQSSAPKSEARVYFGYKGLRTAHEHLYAKLKKGEEYVFLGISAYQPPEQHLYWKRDHVRSSEAGIRRRLLFNKGTADSVLKDRNSYRFCEARRMPSGMKTPAGFLIYKDTVTIMLQHPTAVGVEIVNQDIADSFKAYFDEFWKRSAKFVN